MNIESTIRRKNGTVVTLDDHRYHFKPSATDERHLAEVTTKAHIARFLSIPEGYQLADDNDVVDPVDPPGPVTGTLAGVQEADGTVRTLAQLSEIELRAIALELEIEGANARPLDELIAAIQNEEVEIDGIDTSKSKEAIEPPAQEEPPEPEPEPVKEAVEPASREALAAQYKEKFGKLPHHKLSADRIAQILAEDGAE